MSRAALFGLCVGVAVQAWRNFPPDGALQPNSVLLVSGLAVVLAWLAGGAVARRRLNAHVEAHATASSVAAATAASTSDSSAVASQSVNLVVVTPGQGARPDLLGVPTESVSWMGTPRAQVSADDLDGLDLDELASDHLAPEAHR